MAGQTIASARQRDKLAARFAGLGSTRWINAYLRRTVIADCVCALVAGGVAFELRFDTEGHTPAFYLGLTFALPLLWVVALLVAGAYDARFIGVGSDEFRKVLNGGLGLAAAVAIVAYATKTEVARGYLVIALPLLTFIDVVCRHRLRKWLHRARRRGACMRRVVAVGHPRVIADLASQLRRASYHGLEVVAACVVGHETDEEIAGIPAFAGADSVTDVVRQAEADTVAVLACPEMAGRRLRQLAWDLEKVGIELCVAPALLDVAGPRTTIRPVAGLPLLYMDHPEFTGVRWVIKSLFDRLVAGIGVILLAPLLAAIALAIRLSDGGPALFRQTRIGRGGVPFTVYKFRTMVPDAELRKEQLAALNEQDGPLFKIRRDPRVTAVGGWLRRWSLDELPQLFNVLLGDMSMVGPRPALPEETLRYGDYVRRRLAVKPGITGLWQVSGRSDLPWQEAVRLDLRYVENWSLALDLLVLWKTAAAVMHGRGAY